jgi:UDP-N-acetyl-D-mannosaminuronic acid transferase (WecB/TagA/CpsF family)
VTFVNPQSLLTARRSVGFLDELARFDFVLPDSIVLARLASALRREPVERRSFDGNSLAPAVFAFCRERSLRVGFIGGRPGVAEAAARVFADAFDLPSGPTAAGFFRDRAHRRDILRSLLDHSPDVVVCGMGTGAQERFLLDLVDEGWAGLGFTCGGYLDQAARAGVRSIIRRSSTRSTCAQPIACAGSPGARCHVTRAITCGSTGRCSSWQLG